jgi:putative membrane protein
VRRRNTLILIAFALGTTLSPRLLFGHAIDSDAEIPRNLHDLWHTWGLEPGTLIGLALTAALYGLGLFKTWRAAHVGHGIKKWEATCFTAGWLTLFIALVSPLHPLGEILFSAHMAQHELLMLVAAPLMVLGRPMIAFLRALPAPLAGSLGRFSNTAAWKAPWGAVSHPFSAWSIHAVVLWGWHAPSLFQATLTSEWVHAAQHISFLLSALLFWWAVFHGHRGVTNYGSAVLYLFTTAVHSGLLGALLTFSRTPWYPAYDDTQLWGLSALEDQQLGGLIMWVPACTVYIVAGLALFAKWMTQSDRSARQMQFDFVAPSTTPSSTLASQRSAS